MLHPHPPPTPQKKNHFLNFGVSASLSEHNSVIFMWEISNKQSWLTFFVPLLFYGHSVKKSWSRITVDCLKSMFSFIFSTHFTLSCTSCQTFVAAGKNEANPVGLLISGQQTHRRSWVNVHITLTQRRQRVNTEPTVSYYLLGSRKWKQENKFKGDVASLKVKQSPLHKSTLPRFVVNSELTLCIIPVYTSTSHLSSRFIFWKEGRKEVLNLHSPHF